jgi:perosamine synthetase
MTNIQAAIGLGQLKNLKRTIKKKREIGEIYTNQLKSINEISLSPLKTPFSKNIYWVFGVLINNDNLNLRNITQELRNLGVDSRPFFCPMHMQPILHKYGLFHYESYPIAEKFYKKGFYLPSGTALEKEDIIEICRRFKKVLKIA